MRLLIKHDSRGNVLSVVRGAFFGDALAQPFGVTEEGEDVLEVEVSGELAKLECHDIHEQYRVDVKKKELKKKPGRSTG